MIKIDDPAFARTLGEYNNFLKAWLGRRQNLKETQMGKYYLRHVDELLNISSLQELKHAADAFESKYTSKITAWDGAAKKGKTQFGKFISMMEGYYRDFFGKAVDESMKRGAEKGKDMNVGMWLARRLGVTVCPYCNRHYTFSIMKAGTMPGIRPQFDHYYPKSRYPVLALTLFNLIPACADCNKVKGEGLLGMHPREHSFDSEGVRFRLAGVEMSDASGLWIDVPGGNRGSEICDHIRRLGLEELYQGHRDYVEEIIGRSKAYEAGYYGSLIQEFRGLGMTESEIDRMIWGTYIDAAEHGKRPLSKLTRDLLDDLGIT